MSNRDKPAKDKTEESEHGAPEKLDATEFKLLIECLKHAEGGIKVGFVVPFSAKHRY